MKNKQKLLTEEEQEFLTETEIRTIITRTKVLIGLNLCTMIMAIAFLLLLLAGCGQTEEVREIERVEAKIAALEKQREIDLSHLLEENSPEYHKWESDYTHEIEYLKLSRKAFQALQGDVSTYPIAREYFETYIALFSDSVRKYEEAVNARDSGHKDSLKEGLKWSKEMKEEYEGYLEKLEKVHNYK